MSEIKTAPYELLIRFTCEKGETFGQLRGVHRVMQTCLVNDDGTIAMREGEVAKDFPADQLASVLGEQFSTFLAQYEAEQDAHKATKAKHDEVVSELGKVNFALKSHEEALSELRVAHESLKEKHAAFVAEQKPV